MPLHVQTTIFMICMAYLVLHGAIWFALSEQRNEQVRLWCVSGIISGVSVVLLSLRETVGEFTFVYVAQFLMLIGNMGRTIALRLYLPLPIRPAVVFHAIAGLVYYVWLIAAYEAGTSTMALSVMFFGFYAIVCVDYFLVGLFLNRQSQTLGPRVLALGGLVLSGSLAFKTLATVMGFGAAGIYEPGIDQYVMIAGQFIAISLVNIGFLRIFLDRRQQKNLTTERNLVAAEEHATLLTQHKAELQGLLTEREEIIRQLTLSNKTVGMGALVASLAHELNQPLCAIRLNAQLVERKLNASDTDVEGARKFLDSVINDNRRAANIISRLRSMFDHQDRGEQQLDMHTLLRDTLALVQMRAQAEGVRIIQELSDQPAVLDGDSAPLQQVLLNLLNNAMDALAAVAREQKTIVITTTLKNGQLILHVDDNGCGIPEAKQNSVFELFKTSKAEGMGVGLWLSKTVIQSHRGDIRFTTRPGEGTRFEVVLPAR
jgi:signal transduction histidine kinase